MTRDTTRRDFPIDNYDLDLFTPVAATFGQDRFGYVVTPNADHLIRWHDDANFRESYAAADFVLMDSRFVAKLLRIGSGISLRVCPGSDLTAGILSRVITPQDRIVIIGGDASQAEELSARYGMQDLHHYNPPMGFAEDPQAIETTLRYIEARSPFRFCILAVGAPRQEMLALALARRGLARGLALCVGASINFLTGRERRAPLWMQHVGLEWLYRLLHDPGRMASRYLVRGPRVFKLLPRTRFLVRAPCLSPRPLLSSPVAGL
jgi:exopolysaccharide biosynthesis WecB/TagA/CpsF family protein